MKPFGLLIVKQAGLIQEHRISDRILYLQSEVFAATQKLSKCKSIYESKIDRECILLSPNPVR